MLTGETHVSRSQNCKLIELMSKKNSMTLWLFLECFRLQAHWHRIFTNQNMVFLLFGAHNIVFTPGNSSCVNSKYFQITHLSAKVHETWHCFSYFLRSLYFCILSILCNSNPWTSNSTFAENFNISIFFKLKDYPNLFHWFSSPSKTNFQK